MNISENGADPLVTVTGLSKHYGRQLAVSSVDLTLHAGQMIGLVGANGGGKTTTLRMIAGILRPDAGSGQVLGSDIADTDWQRRQGIGYMTQRPALYPELTVAENLQVHAQVLSPALPKARFDEAIATYGVGTVLGQRFGALSGGWARKVQFVATALHQPRLLLLDEPTAGLDIATRRLIWQWLADFAAAGCGILISTHDLSDAEHCDLLLPYHAGESYGLITPADFIRNARADNLEQAMMHFAQGIS